MPISIKVEPRSLDFLISNPLHLVPHKNLKLRGSIEINRGLQQKKLRTCVNVISFVLIR